MYMYMYIYIYICTYMIYIYIYIVCCIGMQYYDIVCYATLHNGMS